MRVRHRARQRTRGGTRSTVIRVTLRALVGVYAAFSLSVGHYHTPTHPRASTREDAVVGVASALGPMNDLRRFSPEAARNVDASGV